MTIPRLDTTGWSCPPSPSTLFRGLVLALLALAAPLRAQPPQYTAAIHVHSQFSNGHLSPQDLAREAAARNIDVLVLIDSLLTTVRYGVWPLDRIAVDGINKMVRPGVRDRGVAAYRAAVAEARDRFPEVVILPGVEVTPHYYWQGSPWAGLELHDFDRHLIVLGLSEDEIENLPVVENETWANTDFDWTLAAGPILFLIGGTVLSLSRRTRKMRLKHYRLRRRQRRWKAGLLLILWGVLLAFNNYPFGRISDPYSGRHDVAAYQRLIDYVREKGGVVYWSYPEATFAQVRAAGATMVSAAHPEDLLLTRGYHGFEGIYGEKSITVTRPGNVWDKILGEYLSGTRSSAPFVTTGIDFHYFKKGSRWFDLDGGQTMLLLEEKSESGVMKALRAGRAYATYQEYDEKIRLSNFSVEAEGLEAGQGESISASGPVTVRARVHWLDQPLERAAPFVLELIEDGMVVERIEGPLPIEVEVERDLEPGRHFLRLYASSGIAYRILSNPIFVSVR